MKTAHSPLPWHVSTNGATRESGGEPAFPGVHDSSRKPHGEDIVCECLGFSEECRANAELIVRAVNSHAELVAALALLLARSESSLDQSATHDGLTNCKAIAQARAVLAKLT